MPKVSKGSAFDLKNYVPILQPEPKRPVPPPPKWHQRLDREKLPSKGVSNVKRKAG